MTSASATQGATWTNWAGTESAHLVRTVVPESVDELAAAMTAAVSEGLHVKPVGAGHSFTGVAVTDGVQVRLDGLASRLDVDPESGLVTIGAGWRLHELGPALAVHGLAMANLGDIDVQTLSGAIGTGTHGTGSRLGGIASTVQALELVLPDGSVVTCSADDDPELFGAARVGLGAFGVVTAVTVQCVPAFALRAVETPMALPDVLDDLDRLTADNDHFEFYWFPHTGRTLTKCNNRVPVGTPLAPLGALRALVEDDLLSNRVFEVLNRVATVMPAAVPRLNAVSARALGAREFVDASYKVFTSTRSVRFREMEWAVPRPAVVDVLTEIRRWVDTSGERLPFPVEVRFGAADDPWLSTAHERDTAWIAVHQYHRMDHRRYFDAVQSIAASVQGRPHWGKLHGLEAAQLASLYPRFSDVLAVRDRVDPGRVLANPYLERVLGP